jgi:hypothetical protein
MTRLSVILAVARRDGLLCACCGATEDLTLDHVIPQSRGGETSVANGQILCRSCNSAKGDRAVCTRHGVVYELVCAAVIAIKERYPNWDEEALMRSIADYAVDELMTEQYVRQEEWRVVRLNKWECRRVES